MKITRSMKIDRSITIGRPRSEVYKFWRNFENLPRFMTHLKQVDVSDSDTKRSHWVAKAPLGNEVEWDAEIKADKRNEMISWTSLPGSQIENGGTVWFCDAPGGRGTELHVIMAYDPPGGTAAAMIARLFGEEPVKQIHDDLRHFKQIMETGEIATIVGQSSGRKDQVEQERKMLEEMTG